ncbi:MAG TPA: hypothetical protein VM285_07455 [Polyangia bacterium]|nr:hypothetical protein [Thermoleophilia bacterium]HUT77505.1 hypothetical protein [Polyangia bacterium]
MTTMVRNIGGLLSDTLSAVGNSSTETEVSSGYLDRTDRTLFPTGPALSCRVVINYEAVLIGSGTLTVAANLQDATSTDGTGVADFGDTNSGESFESAVVQTNAGTTDSTVTGIVEYDVDLSAARAAIRAQQTVAASGTGTVEWSTAIVFGPSRELPSGA